MNQPNFTQLSSKNPNKEKKKLPTMRPGFYIDQLKTNPAQVWRTLKNY